ncbi:hypothetical protein YC2023_100734 [Brassica napus]
MGHRIYRFNRRSGSGFKTLNDILPFAKLQFPVGGNVLHKPRALGLVVLELRLECPSWVRVALATFPPITVRARMEGLVEISLGLPPGNPTVFNALNAILPKKKRKCTACLSMKTMVIRTRHFKYRSKRQALQTTV